MSRVPRKPLEGIPPHPVGAHDWHVQVERNGVFLKKGGSEGSKTFALGYLYGCRSMDPHGPELRLCDAQGRTFVVE